MANRFGSTSLAAAVIFSGLAISAAMVFVGLQVKKTDFKDAMDNKIAQAQPQEEAENPEVAMADSEPSADEVAQNVRKIDLDYDHLRGDENARITIIEYSDFECPFCQRAHSTFESLVGEYDGKVNWVYRHFPLSFHDPAATVMAEASECAAEIGGNGKFWEYADSLFEGKATGDDTSLIKLAVDLKIDKTKFQSCIESDKYDERIATDLAEGARAGVNGTPGNFVYDNKTGKAVSIMGAQPEANFKASINAFLKE